MKNKYNAYITCLHVPIFTSTDISMKGHPLLDFFSLPDSGRVINIAYKNRQVNAFFNTTISLIMIRHTVVRGVLFLAFLLTSTISGSTINDEFDIIRQRVLESSIWPEAGNKSEAVQVALNYSHTLNSSCYWPDLNYDDQSLVEWSPAKHMLRITGILQAKGEIADLKYKSLLFPPLVAFKLAGAFSFVCSIKAPMCLLKS